MEKFRHIWKECIADEAALSLKLVAVSFPDLGDDTGLSLAAMNAVMEMGAAHISVAATGTAVDGVGGVGGLGAGGALETGGETRRRCRDDGSDRALNVWQVYTFTRQSSSESFSLLRDQRH